MNITGSFIEMTGAGPAAGFAGSLLKCIKDLSGEASAKKAWVDSGVSLDQLYPSYMDAKAKQKDVEKAGLSWVL